MSFTLTINNLRSNSLTGIVETVTWTASDTSGNVTVSVPGSTPLTVANGQSLIAYANLSPEIVTTWVTNAIGTQGIDRLQNQLNQRIQAQIERSTFVPPVIGTPWSSNTANSSVVGS